MSQIYSRAAVRLAVADELSEFPQRDTAETLDIVADRLALPVEAVRECCEPVDA